MQGDDCVSVLISTKQAQLIRIIRHKYLNKDQLDPNLEEYK